MKRLFFILVTALLSGYLVFAIFVADDKRDDVICRELIVVVKDSLDRHFVNENGIVASLKNVGLYPLDRFLSQINTDEIERHIIKNKLIATASVYKTLSGRIKIEITQKTPVLRVFSSDGSYYVDELGHIMPSDFQYATYLPVASGSIEKSLAMSDLHKFALFLQKHEFWNNQIEQIYVYPNKEVELIPRVGNHRIILGDFDDFEVKMDNLQLFYEQAIPKMGWGKYTVVNLKYKNQIVCTKK